MSLSFASFRERLRLFCCGVCMGAADLVPGVSGGTMAFILGIYEPFIHALKSVGSYDALSIFRLDYRRFHQNVAWDYLFTLILGIACAFLLFSQGIHSLLEDPLCRVYLYALFFGMVLASVALCLREIKNWTPRLIGACFLGAVVMFGLTYGKIENKQGIFEVILPLESIGMGKEVAINYDFEKRSLIGIDASTLSAMWAKGFVDENTQVYDRLIEKWGVAADFVKPVTSSWIQPWLILCGALGISAMLLPGISGSYILMVLGVYSVAIGALVDFVKSLAGFYWEREAVQVLVNLGIGIVLGAIFFSRIVSWLLKKDYHLTVVILAGCMIGAIQVIWPFWTYTWVIDPLKLGQGVHLLPVSPYLPKGELNVLVPLALGIAGFVLVLFMASFKAPEKTVRLL